MHVTQNGLHGSQPLCSYCTQAIIDALHTSNASYAACESDFLCAACKLTAILYHWSIKTYNEKASQQSMITHVDTKKIIANTSMYLRTPMQSTIKRVDTKKIIIQVRIYVPLSNPLWSDILSNQLMPNTIMAQGLYSTGTNNLIHLVTQCACVLCHKAHLNWGANTLFSIANTMCSLHN